MRRSAAAMGVKDRGQPPGPAPRLYRQVYEIVAARIVSGALPPGTRLQETQLSGEFGISRAPARQALQALAGDGLVAKATGRGYVVDGSEARTAPPAPSTQAPVVLDASASWERIYAEVESEIVARISFGSWRVNEAAMAKHYGVSRTVARDVIGRLQQRGVVRKDEGARWYAPALSPRHIEELYEVRWLLEPTALIKAAPNVSPAFLAFMRAELEEAIDNAATTGGDVLDTLEDQLHVRLLGHCRNETLMQAITLHQSLLVAHHFLYRWTPKLFASEPFLPEHLAVVDLLQAGKTHAAAAHLETHLRGSRDRAIARVDVIRAEFNAEDISFLTPLP